MLLTDLADACQKSGLPVVTIPGWEDRGRPAWTGSFNPRGIICHHTGGRGDGLADAKWMAVDGRTDLPAPLAQLALGRDGTVYVLAAGRANHAGKAKAQGSLPAGDGNELYLGIEAMHAGVVEPWTTLQRDAYVRLVAALCKHYGWAVENVRGHKETSVTGKVDPSFDMDEFRGDVAEALPKPAAKKPLVQRPRTRIAAANMHAPGHGDRARMNRALDRFDHLDFTIVGLSEFNTPMAEEVAKREHWGLHRARPNSGTSGNAVLYWKPVWEFVERENVPVQITGRRLTMAGAILEHRRTGLIVPVLSIHNPPRAGGAATPQSDRDACLAAEFAWAKEMKAKYGRATVLGDFNQPGALIGRMRRAAGRNVDEVYATGDLVCSDPRGHLGFEGDGITDHPAVSVLIRA